MSSRQATSDSGGIQLFPFLAVLLCTMGTLLLLLVVFGEKAKQSAFAEAAAKQAAQPPGASPPAEKAVQTAEQAAQRLAEMRRRQEELDKLRAQAAERLRDEQRRVSHLEDHERRLEHALARLHITLQQLEATENKQHVDQATAERELQRLKTLVTDTEKQLEEAQKETRKRSYAIVPYKGANGTTRRPIYIECTQEAVIIQPEGIRLSAADFDGPVRSGNPLAAAVRAAREELNARPGAAGAAETPDPYPLLIVRPDGATAYLAALSAIRAWDADYGYEFVEADWKLEYPMADPRLEQVMVHAVDQARARQALLAKVAPRRYGGRITDVGSGPGRGGAGHGGTDNDGVGGFDAITQSGGAGDRIGQHAGDGQLGATEDGRTGTNGYPQTNAPDDNGRMHGQYGEIAPAGNSGSGGGLFADEFAANSGANAGDAGSGPKQDATNAGSSGSAAAQQHSGGGANGASFSSTGAPSAGPPPDVHAAPTSASTTVANGAGADDSANSGVGTSGQLPSKGKVADSRGANWVNAAASKRASAIARPIQVSVRPDQLLVMPTDGDASAKRATVVTFNQPTEQVLDQLAASIQQNIKDWGLAGRSMYWRPMLMLQVAPGAERQAARLAELLEDSGVDVRLPQTAALSQEDSSRAR